MRPLYPEETGEVFLQVLQSFLDNIQSINLSQDFAAHGGDIGRNFAFCQKLGHFGMIDKITFAAGFMQPLILHFQISFCIVSKPDHGS